MGIPSANTRMMHTTTVNILFVRSAASRRSFSRRSRSCAALMRSLFCFAVSFWFALIAYILNLPRISMTRAMFLATSTPTFHLLFSYKTVPSTMVMSTSAPLQVFTTADTGSVVGV